MGAQGLCVMNRLPFPVTPEALSEARWLIDEIIAFREVEEPVEAFMPSIEHAVAVVMIERDHWKRLAEDRLKCANDQLKLRRSAEAEAIFAHNLIITQSTLFRQLGAEKAKLAERLAKLQNMWDHVAQLARVANRRKLP